MTDAPATPMLYFARMDVAPDFLARFEDWYARKHAVDLIASGFRSCTAYHAIVGAPLVHNLYEIDDAAVFEGSSYQTARTPERDPERPEVLAHVSSRSNVPSVQTLVALAPDADDDVRLPAILTGQFRPAEGVVAADLEEWAGEAGAALLSAGAASVRRCRREGLHPSNPSPDVLEGLLLATLPEVPDAAAAERLAGVMADQLAQGVQAGVVAEAGPVVVASRRFTTVAP